MLVVDFDALQAVNLLHLIDQVLGQFLLAENPQDVVRVAGAVHQRLTGLDVVTLMDADVLAFRDEIFLRLAHFGGDDDLALSFGILAVGDGTVDLGDDGKLLRLARLEELGDPGQTAGNILGFGRLTGDLGQNVAGTDSGILGHHDIGTYRQHVASRCAVGQLGGLALFVLEGDPRTLGRILRLDDHLARETSHFVDLFLHGNPLDQVAEANPAGDLGENRHGVGVPLGQQVAAFDLTVRGDAHLGAVNHAVALPLTAGFVDDGHLAVAVHDDVVALGVDDGIEVDVLEPAVKAGLQRGLLGAPGGGAADVEGAHGQLGAGLADRLGGNDADSFAEVDHVPAGQVAPVAGGANAAPALAGEHRADAQLLDAGFFDLLHQVFFDLLVSLHQHLAGDRIKNVLLGRSAENAVPEGLDDFATLGERGDLDAVEGAAVMLGDDGILGNIDQTPGEVSGVGRLERSVGQTLAGTVRGNEVLQHRQAFAKVGGDRGFDDLAGRLGHQTAHPGQLPDLLGAAAGPRIGHHVDGVEGGNLGRLPVFRGHNVYREIAQHVLGDVLGTLGPDVDDLVVALTVGDQTFGVLLLDFLDFLNRKMDPLFLAGRNDHVVQADGDAGDGGEAEAGLLEPVGQNDGLLVAGQAETDVDEVGDLLLGHHPIDMLEGNGHRHDLAQQDAADSGFHQFYRATFSGRHAHLDLGLQIGFASIVGDTRLFR